MNEYTEHNPSDDLVLTPTTGLRGKRNAAFGKGAKIVATVFLDVGQYQVEYSMPSVSLNVQRTWESTGETYEDPILTVSFQRTRMGAGRPVDAYATMASGFLAGSNGRKWSQSYAGRIEARLENARILEAGLSILERAKESLRDDHVVRAALNRCQLLAMIVGLRRIGVQVTIHNARKHLNARKSPEYQLTA